MSNPVDTELSKNRRGLRLANELGVVVEARRIDCTGRSLARRTTCTARSAKRRHTMHFQVKTDNHIQATEELVSGIRSDVEAALDHRFHDQLRRVEVYLQDMNAHKKGEDKHCTLE